VFSCGRRLTHLLHAPELDGAGALARGSFRGNRQSIDSDLQSIESTGVPDRKETDSQSISR
jgi:hypothetical protein